jgi:prepilin signal peptidase PulO-like enzyme (type II secretory pathway)
MNDCSRIRLDFRAQTCRFTYSDRFPFVYLHILIVFPFVYLHILMIVCPLFMYVLSVRLLYLGRCII